MSTRSRLFRPLDYLRIKHHAKPKYDVYLPAGCSLVGTLILLSLPVTPSIVGQDGLIEIFTGLLQMLIGFYIASLAAIATFNKEGMDTTMPGKPPTLTITDHKGTIKIDKLTRRRFLCLMFGYLALLSIFLYFLGASTSLIASNAKVLIAPQYLSFFKWGFVLIYLFFASSLIVTTLLGLFYMVDRIHRHTPVVKKGTNNDQPVTDEY